MAGEQVVGSKVESVESVAGAPEGQWNETGRGERRDTRREIKEEGEEELERNVGRDVVPESYGMLSGKRWRGRMMVREMRVT